MQPPAQPTRPPFSWRKGWLHASAVAGLLVLLSLIAFIVTSSRAVQVRIISETTEAAVWSIPLTLAASYAYQTRRKILGGAMLLLAGILALALLRSLLQTAARFAEDAPMTAAERERPARDASQPRLCQTALGFSFPDPGPPYAPDPATEERIQAKDTVGISKTWVWKGSGAGAILVQAFRGTGGTEDSFRDFAVNVETGVAAAGHMSPVKKSLHWDGGGELTLTTASLENGVQVYVRCLTRSREGDRPPLAVCLNTYTGKGDPLRALRAGLSVAPCGDQ
jgi:hypothetical protein